MDTIRKPPAMPHEQCDKTPETSLVAQRDPPARPLDLLFPVDSSAPDDARAKNAVPFPLFRRVTPRPPRLAAPASAGTPDWSLSAGAAVVLLGFAIAFGTYVTLTQRDAMQSRLRRIVNQNELRTALHHDHATITERTQELAQTLREQIEALRSLDVADAAAIAGTAAIPPANAHSSTLASSAPSLPSRSTPPAPNKALASQSAAKPKPLAPPLPQPAPRAHQVASTEPTPMHARPGAPAPRDHTTTSKPARPPAATAQQEVKAHAPAARSVAVKQAAAPVPHTAPPPTVQAYVQPDILPAVAPVADSKLLYRQH